MILIFNSLKVDVVNRGETSSDDISMIIHRLTIWSAHNYCVQID